MVLISYREREREMEPIRGPGRLSQCSVRSDMGVSETRWGAPEVGTQVGILQLG